MGCLSAKIITNGRVKVAATRPLRVCMFILLQLEAEPEEAGQSGSYDKVTLRPSLPRQAKNKKEQ